MGSQLAPAFSEFKRTDTRPQAQRLPKPFAFDVPQHGDALELLRRLPSACSPLVWFDPQFRALLDRQSYGNEGRSRQCRRAQLPTMSEEYIDSCCREIARVLTPSGYCLRWAETFAVCEGHHLRVKDILPCVDKIVWDNLRIGMGYRARHRGDDLLVLQRPPLRAKKTWHDHGIPNRFPEKIDPTARRIHPHIKPAGLINRLIACVTRPGDLVIDPCAGSFVVLQECQRLGRRFVGCDIAFED
jgi:site-specific DNA-methyltransferase (adenine-specific)